MRQVRPVEVNDLRSRVSALIDTLYERDGHILSFSAWWLAPSREGNVTSFVYVSYFASVIEVRGGASSLASEIHFPRVYDRNAEPSLKSTKKAEGTRSFILRPADVVVV
ncbi:hypothetical protein [Pyrobaculum sp.]|uniref:hypothetical protein n=1 Tax=Pyrobaculum sp. TaxID=2004705 RepID=UPI003D0EC819